MKYDIESAMSRISYYKVMGVRPNFSQLAKEIGVDRHTLSDMYYERREFKPRERTSQLDKYKDEIREILKDPSCNIAAAYFYLSDSERGENAIKCTLSNFTKYVNKNRLNQKIKGYIAHFRYETEPGEQLQVDWVENLKLFTVEGEELQFNLFSATLGYSRMHYFEYSKSKTEEDFMRCLLHTFEYFGGKTKKVLTDNMSAIINIDKSGNRNIHPTIIQFFKDIDVELKLCKVRTPQTKGKCEVANKFAQWLYSYNTKITDELHLFKKIYRLNETINKKTVNQFLGRPPIALFQKEKELLKEINSSKLETITTIYAQTSKVPQTGLINYNGKYYSVDEKFIGKRVKIEGNGKKVLIFYNSLLIAKHDVTDQKVNYSKGHYSAFLRGKNIDEDLIDDYSQKALERFKKI